MLRVILWYQHLQLRVKKMNEAFVIVQLDKIQLRIDSVYEWYGKLVEEGGEIDINDVRVLLNEVKEIEKVANGIRS